MRDAVETTENRKTHPQNRGHGQPPLRLSHFCINTFHIVFTAPTPKTAANSAAAYSIYNGFANGRANMKKNALLNLKRSIDHLTIQNIKAKGNAV
jgi:hypothetical protein